jgi:pyruvate kinase
MAEPEALYAQLFRLREEVTAEADEQFERWRSSISRGSFLPSAANLAAYLALRRRDLRPLQLALMPLGLSSLGRCESRVRESLDAVLAALGSIVGAPAGERPPPVARFFEGTRLLEEHTEEAFGATPVNRQVRIMVTLDAASGGNRDNVESLVRGGMDVARINSAHGDPDSWRLIAKNVRAAAAAARRHCGVCFDLTGPRARTGSTSPEADRLGVGDTFRLVLDKAEASELEPFAESRCPSCWPSCSPGQRSGSTKAASARSSSSRSQGLRCSRLRTPRRRVCVCVPTRA